MKEKQCLLLTLPLSSRSWHLFRQSGLLVNSTKAFSACRRVVVSVVSYSCLHRISSWARLWNTGGELTPNENSKSELAQTADCSQMLADQYCGYCYHRQRHLYDHRDSRRISEAPSGHQTSNMLHASVLIMIGCHFYPRLSITVTPLEWQDRHFIDSQTILIKQPGWCIL